MPIKQTDEIQTGEYAVDHLCCASEALRSGDFTSAVSSLRTLINKNPYDYQAHILLGHIFFKTFRIKESIIEYRKSVRIDSKNPEGQFFLGMAYLEWDRPDKALVNFLEVKKLAPNGIGGEMDFFDEDFGRDEFLDASIEICEDILMRDKTFCDHCMKNIVFYIETRHYDKAMNCLNFILYFYPENLTARYYLGWIYFKRHQDKNALKEFQKIVELNPSSIEARRNIGLVYARQKEFDSAREVFRQLLADCPDDQQSRKYLDALNTPSV